MVEKVAIGAMIGMPFFSCHEKVVGMMEQMANSPPAAMSACLGNLPPSLDDIQTPMISISEEEQLVGHE
jgi:hypothetical protein